MNDTLTVSREYVFLKELANISTADNFKKQVSDSTYKGSIRRIEYPIKKKQDNSTVSDITKSITINMNSVVIIPRKSNDIFYIPFLLDSLFVKTLFLESNTTVRKLSNVPVITIDNKEKEYFSRLEIILLAIKKMGEGHIEYEYFYTAERLLSEIRDAMVFELYNDNYIHSENIHLIDNWKIEIDKIEQKNISRGADELIALVNSILTPNNALYDNLKRFYLFLDRNFKH